MPNPFQFVEEIREMNKDLTDKLDEILVVLTEIALLLSKEEVSVTE